MNNCALICKLSSKIQPESLKIFSNFIKKRFKIFNIIQSYLTSCNTVKCNTQAQTVEIEEELTDASVEDVKEALPDGSPR
jgi:hypothetical protein